MLSDVPSLLVVAVEPNPWWLCTYPTRDARRTFVRLVQIRHFMLSLCSSGTAAPTRAPPDGGGGKHEAPLRPSVPPPPSGAAL